MEGASGGRLPLVGRPYTKGQLLLTASDIWERAVAWEAMSKEPEEQIVGVGDKKKVLHAVFRSHRDQKAFLKYTHLCRGSWDTQPTYRLQNNGIPYKEQLAPVIGGLYQRAEVPYRGEDVKKYFRMLVNLGVAYYGTYGEVIDLGESDVEGLRTAMTIVNEAEYQRLDDSLRSTDVGETGEDIR